MLAGEDGPGGLAFNDYETTYFVGSLALAIILFDGGLRSNLSTFRGIIFPAALLATVDSAHHDVDGILPLRGQVAVGSSGA